MPRRFPIPCLQCGQVTTEGSYCKAHTRGDTPQRKEKKRQLYNTQYKRAAKHIRDTATHCWICGGAPTPSDPLQADHLIPTHPDSPLAPAHRSCNAWRGNRDIETTLKHRQDAPGGAHNPERGKS